MAEIDIIHVSRDRDGDYEAYTPAGAIVHSSDPNFDLKVMAELMVPRGAVTRWSEPSPDDSVEVDSDVVLIGWADAPISRDDVETHRVGYGVTSLPAINIKVYDLDLPTGDAFAEVVAEHELDPRLKALPLSELRPLVERYLEADADHVFNWVCERGFENVQEDAVHNIFPGQSIKVFSEGRQGGWLVVEGLPDIEHWDAEMLTAWHQLAEACKAEVTNIPRAMVWDVLANHQDDLAGRVVSVRLTFILAEADLAALEADDNVDPKGWDWQGALDFSVETEIRAE